MDEPKPIGWQWLGQLSYGDVLQRQHDYRESVLQQRAPEALWLLEHTPVVTVGRRPSPETPSPDELRHKGIDFFATQRGGLATWHGPGQLVVYAFIDAYRRRLGVKGTIDALETGVINWLSRYEIPGHRRTKHPGIWVENDKICAIGMHFRKGVSMHGLALNLNPDMSGFDLITPCGITDGGMTSVFDQNGNSPSPKQSATSVAADIIHALIQSEKRALTGKQRTD